MKILDQFKLAFTDALTPEAAREIRQRCPELDLNCMFSGIPLDGGAYSGADALSELSVVDLLSKLEPEEKQKLEEFVKSELGAALQAHKVP